MFIFLIIIFIEYNIIFLILIWKQKLVDMLIFMLFLIDNILFLKKLIIFFRLIVFKIFQYLLCNWENYFIYMSKLRKIYFLNVYSLLLADLNHLVFTFFYH